MFADMLSLVFGGCVNPMEYTLVFLLFYMLIDETISLIGTVVSISRR